MEEATSDGALNDALHASCFLFNSVKQHLDASSEDVVSISRKDLTKLRRAALKVNRNIGTIVRQANQREQRLVVDMHHKGGVQARRNRSASRKGAHL